MKPTTSALHTLSALVLSAWFASTAVAQDLVKVAVPQRGTWETSVADMGEQAKIFAKHGIKIESLYTQGGGETMQALISGSVDVALSTGAAAMFAAYVKGAPTRPIGSSITGAREVYWYVKSDSPIKSLKDASGKTMAFSANGSSSHLATLKLIKMAGVDIKPVPTGAPPASFTQTMTGQVDIGWSAVPFGLTAMQEGRIRAIANIYDIPEYRDMSVRFHLANRNFITGRPDVLKRFLAAYDETLDWMYGGGDAPIEMFSKLYNVKADEMRQARKEYYTRQSMDIRHVGGLDQSMADAVAYKFIPQPLTKAQLDDLFKYAAK
jgi:NitT/TauT family transport system substrate-binding protein